MRRGFDNHFIPRLGMGFDGQLIGHCPRGDEEGSLFSEKMGHLFLEGIHSRVFSKDIIPHLCFYHRLSHGRSRFSDRIASKINIIFHLLSQNGSVKSRGQTFICPQIVYYVKSPFTLIVIPGLTRNPVFMGWIPAGVYPVLRYGAGMTASELNPSRVNPDATNSLLAFLFPASSVASVVLASPFTGDE